MLFHSHKKQEQINDDQWKLCLSSYSLWNAWNVWKNIGMIVMFSPIQIIIPFNHLFVWIRLLNASNSEPSFRLFCLSIVSPTLPPSSFLSLHTPEISTGKVDLATCSSCLSTSNTWSVSKCPALSTDRPFSACSSRTIRLLTSVFSTNSAANWQWTKCLFCYLWFVQNL